MAAQLVLHGMVLSVLPVGEADKRIVLLTRERGKISAFAKGARRSNSPLLAKCQSFAVGEFSCYEGKDSYTIVQAEISRYFHEVQKDLEAVCYGCYFCEFAAYFARENLEAGELLDLLYVTLSMLVEKRFPYSFLRYIFEWKVLTLEGEAPWMFDCVACHCKEGPFYFSYEKCGVLCKDCMQKYGKKCKENRIGLEETIRLVLGYISTSPMNRVYRFQISKDMAENFSKFVHSYVKRIVVHDFKSLKMIEPVKDCF